MTPRFVFRASRANRGAPGKIWDGARRFQGRRPPAPKRRWRYPEKTLTCPEKPIRLLWPPAAITKDAPMPILHPTIVEHPIPTRDSRPYILAEGPDGCVWFCESGPGQIGRLDLASGDIAEFPLPDPGSVPIGIAAGADGAMWFTQSAAHKVGRIDMRGAIS
jgi:hypothetical protein